MAYTSKALAQLVERNLKRQGVPCPSKAHLNEIFEVLFYASLKTEEAHHVSCDLIWKDPENPDPTPPPRVRAQRWRFFPFAKPLPFTVNALTKAASASDPRSGSFVVYPDKTGLLQIWGLVDQSLSYERSVLHEEGAAFDRPGLFQARITGVGQIAAWHDRAFLGELRGEALISKTLDVFGSGLILESLKPGILRFADYANTQHADLKNPAQYVRDFGKVKWIQTLCRLLIRIEGYGHGGALIVTPDEKLADLNVKYPLAYDGIPKSLAGAISHEIDASYYTDALFEILDDETVEEVPVTYHLGEAVAEGQLSDYRQALEGALWFSSLFSKVDGAIVCDGSLNVFGYGAEITVKNDPTKVWLCGSANGKSRKQISLDRFGTRHRSMMRYCVAHPGAVGFVISQDGGVKSVVADGNEALLWENIRVRREYQLPRRRVRRSS